VAHLVLDARCENEFVNLCSSSRKAEEMSLRWIHENLKAPTCDEECSDIDDSCSDDSYDTELSLQEDDITENGKVTVRDRRIKRETRRAPTSTATFDGTGYSLYPNLFCN